MGDITCLEANGPFVNLFKSDAQIVWNIISKWSNGNKTIVSQMNHQKKTKNGHKVYFNLTVPSMVLLPLRHMLQRSKLSSGNLSTLMRARGDKIFKGTVLSSRIAL